MAFIVAAANGYLHILECLFYHGQVDVCAENGWALKCAAKRNHSSVVRYLLDRGANRFEQCFICFKYKQIGAYEHCIGIRR